MNNCNIDPHLSLLIVIMIVIGAFGGLLNYLFNFDTAENDQKKNVIMFKYILLGIGAALLVPVFLKMISSNLTSSQDNNDYLIFAGFCLIAAIFSKRFITTIGEKILESAKKAEKSAMESKQKSEITQLELTSTKERIEDVKLAVDIKNSAGKDFKAANENPQNMLIELANSYVRKTSVPDYSERLKLKAEFGRKMGEIIARNNLPKEELYNNYPSEGMYLALSYAVQLHPDDNCLSTLNQIAKSATQLYTKFSILIGYNTLARNGFIHKSQVPEIYQLIIAFRENADKSLIRTIDDSIGILKFIEPNLE
jgi:hypothetical protein